MTDAARREPAGDPLPDLSVQSFAACEVGPDVRLVGAAVEADTIYLVLAGRLHLTLPKGTLTANAGSLVLVPAGLQPSIAASAQPTREYVATRERLAQRGGLMVFDAAQGGRGTLRVMVGRVRGELSATLRGSEVSQALVANLKGLPLARVAYAALRDELDRPAAGLPVLAATLMKACVLLFIRTLHRHKPTAPTGTAGHRIAGVIAAIRSRPSASYSIDTMAELAGMSRATFTRQFQRHVDTTPMDFVLRARLQEAAGLLRNTSLPIKQVANDAGFQNRSHFSRAFQGQFGVDPTRYRANGRGSDSVQPPMLGDVRA